MTIDKTIISALSLFNYACYHDTYTGTDETYFVFNYNVIPTAYSDDNPFYNRYSCQIHLYCPITMNTITLAKQIKLAIENAGFTYPNQENASDVDTQHLVFEFEGIEYIERDDE